MECSKPLRPLVGDGDRSLSKDRREPFCSCGGESESEDMVCEDDGSDVA